MIIIFPFCFSSCKLVYHSDRVPLKIAWGLLHFVLSVWFISWLFQCNKTSIKNYLTQMNLAAFWSNALCLAVAHSILKQISSQRRGSYREKEGKILEMVLKNHAVCSCQNGICISNMFDGSHKFSFNCFDFYLMSIAI